MAQVEAERDAARAENSTLRAVAKILIEEMDPVAFGRARGRLAALDAGEAVPDEPVR